ncbi:MAG TPA: chorismate mutase [Candidatus Acidoferrales bacterium]|jgi:chorismate mutase-like protein|nr:chorismate mutase [Candidatus Acidoferrales bacterium]
MDISDWRKKIDAVDTAVLHLLNLRAGFALEVGKIKGAEGISMRTPERERQIVERMQSLNPGPLDAEAIGLIYETIVSQCIRAQERSRTNAEPSRK